MADFKLLGSEEPVTAPLGTMTQGIGYPLRQVDPATQGGQVNVTSTQVLRAADYTTQEPSAVDTPLQIKFGVAKTGAGLDVDALGNVTCTTAGEYTFRIRLQIGRTNNPGSAIIFVRFLLNGVQAFDPVFTNIADSNDQIPTTFEGLVTLEVGDIVTAELYRDSSGNNSGGVFTEASTLGWGDAPSALFVATRTVAVQT